MICVTKGGVKSKNVQGIKSKGKRGFKGKCCNCGRVGHKESECRDKERENKGNGASQAKSGSDKARLKGKASMIRTRACAIRGVKTQGDPEGNADSGASDHFVNDNRLFSFSEKCTPLLVEVANGHQDTAEWRGMVNIAQFDGRVLSFWAYFVPSLQSCFYSIQKADEAGLRIVIEHGICTVSDGDTIYLQIPRRDKAYGFKIEVESKDDVHRVIVQDEKQSLEMACSLTKSTSGIWHRRLGHINGKKLKILAQTFDYITDKGVASCEVCSPNKSKRPNFGTRSKAVAPLEMIHSDVCYLGVDSEFGANYFTTVIDDYSSFCQIYLSSHKSEAAANVL